MPPSPPILRPCNHYSVLGLDAPVNSCNSLGHSELGPKTTKLDIKHAYHRALLSHHPDKRTRGNESSLPSEVTQNRRSSQITVDDIVKAYQVLSDDASRKQYDKELTSGRLQWMRTHHSTEYHGGSSTSEDNRDQSDSGKEQQDNSEEIVYKLLDLDEMSAEETSTGEQIWYTSCRCGLSKGYTVTEEDLESGSQRGEIEAWTQCSGCSLWIVVAYAVSEDEKQDRKGF